MRADGIVTPPAASAGGSRLVRKLGDVAYTLAVMQAETPQEIAEQLFSFLPTGEEWSKILAGWLATVEEIDD
jgi:hypothetical protein